MFGIKGLLNEEFTDQYSSANVIRMIKSRSMKWRGMKHVGGRGELYRGVWCGKLRERGHLAEAGADGRVVFRWIFRK